jgi:hypothetical protein
MASGYRIASGVDFDDVFEPRKSAPSGAVGLRDLAGSDLSNRYEPIASGTQAPATGFRVSSGADVCVVWAAKGSVSQSLPINGQIFTANSSLRGSGTVRFWMYNNGTYAIERVIGGTSTILTSGTWLPAGQSVGSFSAQFGVTQQGSVIGTASNTTANQAPAQVNLGTTVYAEAKSSAPLVGQRAQSSGDIAMSLFKAGVLQATTTIHYNTSCDGN